ncbi:MAG: response regulator transcription factor [Saprospiraceae bacterium]|nr:response regulator transcription factor [Saprospiraceae bacterium]
MGTKSYWPDQLPTTSYPAAIPAKTDTRIMLAVNCRYLCSLIRQLLAKNCPGARVVGETDSLHQAEHLLRNRQVDLLFLDVELKDGAGFDLLDRLPELNTQVVFTTAHHEAAIRAFRYNAVDCLLKPLVPHEFYTAVKKARQRQYAETIQQQYALILQNQKGSLPDKIALPVGSSCVFAQANEITRLESCGNYTFVYFANRERCLVSRNLKHFEQMLPGPCFFRLHQSHIINIAFVRQFVNDPGCGLAIMQDGARIPVSRRRKDDFLGVLKGV